MFSTGSSDEDDEEGPMACDLRESRVEGDEEDDEASSPVSHSLLGKRRREDDETDAELNRHLEAMPEAAPAPEAPAGSVDAEDPVEFVPLDSLYEVTPQREAKRLGYPVPEEVRDEDTIAREQGISFCFLCYAGTGERKEVYGKVSHVYNLKTFIRRNMMDMDLKRLAITVQSFYNKNIRPYIQDAHLEEKDTVWRRDIIYEHITEHEVTKATDALLAVRRLRALLRVCSNNVVMRDDHGNMIASPAQTKLFLQLLKEQKAAMSWAEKLVQ